MSLQTRLGRRRASGLALALLCTALASQVGFGLLRERPTASASELPPPPAPAVVAWLRAFDPLPAAHVLVLYLQTFDNQPGVSLAFSQLDYTRVAAWLETALQLDPAGQYPLLMASQLYAQVPDRERQRAMLRFVYEHYLQDPQRRWRWLAHAAIMAKHRLNDMPLALEYAQAIARSSPGAPPWARQMHIFVLEDMGEYDAARVLLGGLLASGEVTDRHEQFLLQEALQRLQAAEKSSGTPSLQRSAP